MDDRIFEIAAGGRGSAGWDPQAFRQLSLSRIGSSVAMKSASRRLKPSAISRRGGQLRVSAALCRPPWRQHARAAAPPSRPGEPERPGSTAAGPRRPTIWEAVGRLDGVRQRVERLGFSRDDVRRIYKRRKPANPVRSACESFASTPPTAPCRSRCRSYEQRRSFARMSTSRRPSSSASI